MQFFRELTTGQRRLLFGVLILTTVLIAFTSHKRSRKIGDFDIQRQFGLNFLQGDPLYPGRLCYNYMPIAAMYYAPLALVPAPLGSALRSLAAIACLVCSLRLWQSMVPGGNEKSTRESFTINAWTLLIASHYLVRDLDDGGPHMILLAMLVGGWYCLRQGRQALAALWFGLAIALKMTPGLVIPYLVWKRRFLAATYTTIATLAWIALPAIYMGPSAWWAAQSEWNLVAIRSMTGDPDDNEARIQNQALKPALMRWMTAYPAGHPLKIEHAWDIAPLNLPPRASKIIAAGAMAALLAAFAFWTRRPYRGAGVANLLPEFAALLILMTLYSPVTWMQHLVWTVPAVWLMVDSYRTTATPWSRPAKIAFGVFLVITLVLNREVLGRDNYFVLLSWHLHTICQLILLGLLVYIRRLAELPHGSKALAESR